MKVRVGAQLSTICRRCCASRGRGWKATAGCAGWEHCTGSTARFNHARCSNARRVEKHHAYAYADGATARKQPRVWVECGSELLLVPAYADRREDGCVGQRSNRNSSFERPRVSRQHVAPESEACVQNAKQKSNVRLNAVRGWSQKKGKDGTPSVSDRKKGKGVGSASSNRYPHLSPFKAKHH